MITTKKSNNIKLIEQVDSSELSSDIPKEKNDKPIKKEIFTPPSNQSVETFNEEFNIANKMKIKRPRFYSENDEHLFSNRKTKNGIKIKKIDEKLKNFTEDELINSNVRKFTFL